MLLMCRTEAYGLPARLFRGLSDEVQAGHPRSPETGASCRWAHCWGHRAFAIQHLDHLRCL